MPGVTDAPATPARREHRLAFRREVAAGSGAHAARLEPADAGTVELVWRGPALMGVLNVTPDSFSDGGALTSVDAAVERGLELAEQGALFVDVGGESTRPGAEPLAVDVEMARIAPVVAALAGRGVRVSVDTRSAAVAQRALALGACLVNDVGGLRDPAMVAACAAAGAAAVVVHMQGRPSTMQARPRYVDVVGEVETFLLERAAAARAAGVPGIVIDPGFGFGKTVEHNLALVRASPRLASHGPPLLLGASRKGTIGVLAGIDDARARLPGTLALHLRAVAGGTALLRVHDVAEHRQALAVWAALEA